MSESHDSVRRRERGELARVFLEAARYSDGEINMLGDLSLVSFEQVKALLAAKLEEAKVIESVIAKNASDFRLLRDPEKPK
jgi:hypothetical protein